MSKFGRVTKPPYHRVHYCATCPQVRSTRAWIQNQNFNRKDLKELLLCSRRGRGKKITLYKQKNRGKTDMKRTLEIKKKNKQNMQIKYQSFNRNNHSKWKINPKKKNLICILLLFDCSFTHIVLVSHFHYQHSIFLFFTLKCDFFWCNQPPFQVGA